MQKNYFFLVVFLVFIFSSCKKELVLDPNTDYLIFGTFAINTRLFLIQNNKVFAGDNIIYLSKPLKFQSTALSNDKYLIAAKLPSDFPSYLTEKTDSSYGCPNCYDQGGIYIELVQSNKKRSWTIDSETNAIPSELKKYVGEIESTVSQLLK